MNKPISVRHAPSSEIPQKTNPLKFACSWCGVLANQPCVDIQLGRWIGDIHFDRAFHAQQCDNREALRLLATSARRPEPRNEESHE